MKQRIDARAVAALALMASISPPGVGAQEPAPSADLTSTTAYVPPHARDGSGTSWLPDETLVFAHHAAAGRWNLMLHENVFLHYIDETGERGGRHFGSLNWIMGMAERNVGGGRFGLRGMLSLEPLTVGKCGYPNMLQTGELCNGRPIVNGQHPHDLVMELAATWERGLSPGLGVQLYAAAAGEPALGPVAFPHRPSAMPNPVAPISHHWMDASHISFGVATLGLYGRRWKIEGSAFNGREPDEDRYGLDFGPLDSYSGRLTVLPGDRWAIQVSAGRMADAHVHVGVPTPGRLCPAGVACHPIGQIADAQLDVVRGTASIIHQRPLGRSGHWDTTVAYGRNYEEGHRETQGLLVETSVDPGGFLAFFARGELVEKSDHDLAIPLGVDVDVYRETLFTIGKATAGIEGRLPTIGGIRPGLGLGASLSVLPDNLEDTYGSTRPVGWFSFLRLSPAPRRPVGDDHPHE